MHIYAALCGKAQGGLQLTVQNEVGRDDMYAAPGAVEQVDVHHLAHPLAIQRAVAVGDDKAVGLRFREGAGEELRKLRLALDAPHLQKQSGHGAHALALQHDSGVLPAAIFFNVVDVLVGQIHAAGKAYTAIHDKDLAVVAVVVVGGNKGRDRRKYLALDTQRFQPSGVVPGQGGELAGAVIHYPHIHALRGLACQNFQNAPPHQPFVNDEVFQKNVLGGAFQLGQQRSKLGFSAGEIGHLRVFVHREAAAPSAQILRQRGRAGAVSVQRRARLFVLWQLTAGLPLQLQQALFEHSMAYVLLGVAEQQHAQHRGKRRDHQPRDAHAVVHVLIEQVDHHGRRDQQGAAQVVGQQVAEPAHQAEQRPEL